MKRFLIAAAICAVCIAGMAVADLGSFWASTSASAPADAGQCFPLGGIQGYRPGVQAGQAPNATFANCNTQCLCVPVDGGWDVYCNLPGCTAQCVPQPNVSTRSTTFLDTYGPAPDAGTGNCIDGGAANCKILDAGAGNCLDAGVGNIVCDPLACGAQGAITVPNCNPQPPTADAGPTVDAGTGNCVDAGAANTTDGAPPDAGTGNCATCVPVDAGAANCYAAPNCVDAGTGNCIDGGLNNTGDAGATQCYLGASGSLQVWACSQGGQLARNKNLDLTVPSTTATDCGGGQCISLAWPDMVPSGDVGGVYLQVNAIPQTLPDSGPSLDGGIGSCSPVTAYIDGAKRVN